MLPTVASRPLTMPPRSGDDPMTDLDIAREQLAALDATCVLRNGGVQLVSHQRGVRPLLTWLDEGRDLRGFVAADKVVGNGAAYLYVLLGVAAVHANVMSEPACATLQRYGIQASCDQLVPGIVNRAGDGPCPIEFTVRDASTPDEALIAIRTRLATL